MQVKSLFFEGRREDTQRELTEIARTLEEQRVLVHRIPVDEILRFFDALGLKIEEKEVLRRKAGASMKDLARFLREENLGKNLDLALRGSRLYLDRFLKPESHDFFLHAQPRGLAVEWLAGNIPFLGIYSLAEVLATKNVLLLKAASGEHDTLLDLLECAAAVAREKEVWRILMRALAVVLVPSDETSIQRELSLLADVRLIWGGEKSTQAILSLSKRFFTEDIVYGPKYSYAAIGREIGGAEMERAAAALAVDIANFDQYACSSPHTVFVEEGGAGHEAFAKAVARELERVTRLLIPKGEEDPRTVLSVMTIRADYADKGVVIVPQGGGSEWTVVATRGPGLVPLIGSRTIFVKPVRNLEELSGLNDRAIQTIGISGFPEEMMEEVDLLTLKGGDRLPKLGSMSFFTSPWDGLFAMDRLVRWVRLH